MDPTTKLADLVSGSGAAARVLQRHGLDFCCGGKQTLAEACSRANLDPAEVLGELESDGPVDDVDATVLPSSELVDYILVRFHEPLRPELARLVGMARKAARVHGAKPDWPNALLPHLESVQREVGEHLVKEERILFPAIQAGRGHLARMPIQVMIREHEDHGSNLERTRELTNDFRPPDAACATWRALYQGLEELELELMRHIHLENNVLFPKVLTAEA